MSTSTPKRIGAYLRRLPLIKPLDFGLWDSYVIGIEERRHRPLRGTDIQPSDEEDPWSCSPPTAKAVVLFSAIRTGWRLVTHGCIGALALMLPSIGLVTARTATADREADERSNVGAVMVPPLLKLGEWSGLGLGNAPCLSQVSPGVRGGPMEPIQKPDHSPNFNVIDWSNPVVQALARMMGIGPFDPV